MLTLVRQRAPWSQVLIICSFVYSLYCYFFTKKQYIIIKILLQTHFFWFWYSVVSIDSLLFCKRLPFLHGVLFLKDAVYYRSNVKWFRLIWPTLWKAKGKTGNRQKGPDAMHRLFKAGRLHLSNTDLCFVLDTVVYSSGNEKRNASLTSGQQ